MIDRATVDKIIDAANIVDVVSEFVTLRKAGVNYKGLCPFHDDTTPSFMVSPAKNICHCFACGKGGTPVSFLMEHEQITYPEALRWLAKKYNIEIEERELTDEEKKEQSERESMFIVNEWARDYFHDILNNDVDGQAIGKQYFRSRSIRDDIIEKFQLGFSPTKRDAVAQAAQAKGYQKEFLVKTGLCIENEKGIYDRYSGRVIFPWLNVSGKVVAFGGRLLDSRTKGVQQKYVNSPDSEIYHKERELYGLYQAKKAIVKEDCVYMVEGYTDVIAMHQCGLENVVANSGTALSVYQIRLLHRFTSNIVLLYDGDEAGIHAAIRGTDMLLQEGMNIKVLILPDGDDPDSFSRKHSAQEFKSYIEEHQTDFIEFKTRLLIENEKDPIKRSEAISSIVRSISVIPNQIVRDTYLTTCAHRLQVSEQTLLNVMNNYIRRDIEEKEKEREREQRSQDATTPVEENPPASLIPIGLHTVGEQVTEVERLMIQNIIRHGEEVIYENVETEEGDTVNLTLAQYVAYDLGQDGLTFHDELYNRILAECVEHCGEPGFKAATYFTQHPDIEVSQLASKMIVNRYQLGKRFENQEREGGLRQRILHLVLNFRMDIIVARMKEIKKALSQPGMEKDQIMQLMTEYKETQELRDALAKQLGRDVVG